MRREIKFRGSINGATGRCFFNLRYLLAVAGLKFDKVEQLVWVDSNGDEIYEGDLITDQYGEDTFVAQLWSTAVGESDDADYYAIGSPMDERDFFLKEAEK